MRALVYHLNHLELRKQANVTEPLGQAPVVQSRNPLDLTVEMNMNYEDMNYENLLNMNVTPDLNMNGTPDFNMNYTTMSNKCDTCFSSNVEFDNSLGCFVCMGCGGELVYDLLNDMVEVML